MIMNIQVLLFVLVVAQVNCDCSMKNPCTPLKGLQFIKLYYVEYFFLEKKKSDAF